MPRGHAGVGGSDRELPAALLPSARPSPGLKRLGWEEEALGPNQVRVRVVVGAYLEQAHVLVLVVQLDADRVEACIRQSRGSTLSHVDHAHERESECMRVVVW